MKKAKAYFHGLTDTKAQVAKRTASKLKAAHVVALLASAPPLTGGSKSRWDKYLAGARKSMRRRAYEADKLCMRATAQTEFAAALDILSELAALIDIDKAFKKRVDGKWTNA